MFKQEAQEIRFQDWGSGDSREERAEVRLL